MDTSTHILVIILSAALALFLVLAIVIAIQIIRLIRTVNHIVQRAETVIETAESVGRVFRNVSGPLTAAHVVQNIIENVVQHNKRGKRDEKEH